ncbi:restriction endonuclease [Nocardia farcinica]|uniref:restriction endonuclease n=1 Tax=Nocardia farcinica TaxID=37329 RepID=UPI00245671BB|nr:restriction endonuclease [Nocardia farcinica]
MLDLDSLDWQTFEALAVLLLRRESYKVSIPFSQQRRGANDGVDAIATAPDGARVFVIIKRSSVPTQIKSSHLRHVTDIAGRLKHQYPESRVMYVVSSDLPAEVRAAMGDADVSTWDRADIEHLLSKYPDVACMVEKKATERDLSDLLGGVEQEPKSTNATRIAAELANIHRGRSGWKEYEKSIAKFLTEMFIHHLSPPVIQNRSDDGLDIMDAIFDIPRGDTSWSHIRTQYKTHFIVAEFKNHTELIGPREVRQIAEYLWPRAFRMFGILVSRQGPNEQAIKARRRAWLDDEKLIVFLTDNDLIEMARHVDEDEDPFDMIHEQLMGFFRTLTP